MEEEEFNYKKPKVKEINIDGERIFISKSNLFGYKVCYPIKVDGKINLKNLIVGRTWWNIVFVLVILLILYSLFKEYSQAIRIANDCLLNKVVLP